MTCLRLYTSTAYVTHMPATLIQTSVVFQISRTIQPSCGKTIICGISIYFRDKILGKNTYAGHLPWESAIFALSLHCSTSSQKSPSVRVLSPYLKLGHLPCSNVLKKFAVCYTSSSILEAGRLPVSRPRLRL